MSTIIACCTPMGAGAIALIRISGCNAFSIATHMAQLANHEKLSAQKSHTIHHGWITSKNNSKIDSVLFLLMRTPRSFTGEDTVEITCHNNPFIIEQIIQRAIELGAQAAQPGEFSQQAVINGKIDIPQAEAINEVVRASSQQTLKISLEQLTGSLSSHIKTMEATLLKSLALCEASFEFLDEENINFDKEIIENISFVSKQIDTLKKSFDLQQHLRDGIRIALLGMVNAGKSSLFNAILGKNRAIVSPHAGTTRDTVEAGLYHKGAHWTFIDTAGMRETDHIIEKEGIKRSHEQAHCADIILLVVDCSQEASTAEAVALKSIIKKYKNKIIVVESKADLPSKREPHNFTDIPTISLCSQNNFNLNALKSLINQKVDRLFDTAQAPFLLNTRQLTLINALKKKIHDLQKLLCPPLECEIISHHLQDLLTVTTELTGKSISENGMNAIFRTFCVGK